MYTLRPVAWQRSIVLRLNLAYSFHFFLKIAFFAAFCLLFQKSEAQIIDSIDLQWEQIHGVPANPISYAIGNKRIFALTDFYSRPGLYYSDDMGKHWHRYPQFFSPTEVLADGDVVLVVDKKYTKRNTFTYHDEWEGQLFRSEDGGLSFTQVNTLPYIAIHGNSTNAQAILKKNEDTYVYEIRQESSSPSPSTLISSKDKGRTWQTHPLDKSGVFSSIAEDTFCYMQFKIIDPLNRTGIFTVGISAKSDFSNPQIDTIYEDVFFGDHSEDKVFYINGIFYYPNYGDSINISTDHNKSFTKLPLVAPFTHYQDGYFYGKNDSMLYRIPLDNLTEKEIIHEGADPAYLFYKQLGNYIVKGDTILRATLEGTLLSLDGGISWEKRSSGIETAPQYDFVGKNCAFSAHYRSDSTLRHWEAYTNDVNQSDIIRPYFQINDTIIGINNFKYYISGDKGDTWQQFTEHPFTYLYGYDNVLTSTSLNQDSVAFSLDLGKNWTTFTQENIYSDNLTGLSIEGDWFVFARKPFTQFDKIYKSTDFGQTWTVDTTVDFKLSITGFPAFLKKDYWVTPNHAGQFSISTDFGRTWLDTGNDSLSDFINDQYKSNLIYRKDSIFLYHSEKNLLITNDLGEHWWVSKSPPYLEEYSYFNTQTNSFFELDTARYEYAATGFSYAIYQNYLYVSSTTGNFRAPLYPITGQVPTSEIQLSEKDGLQARLFPNPVSDALHIEMQAKTAFKGTISIVNLLGTRVFSKKIAVQKGSFMENIDCSALEQGLYFCVFEHENGEVLVRKFVVK